MARQRSQAPAANGHDRNGHSIYPPEFDPITFNQIMQRLEQIAANTYTSRESLVTKLLDPRREIATECGYPKEDSWISPEFYQQLYDRECVATRVVECLAKACWEQYPMIFESEDPSNPAPFDLGLRQADRNLRGEQSWWNDEGAGGLLSVLALVDVLSGIGHYGVVLLGLDDGEPLGMPAAGVFNAAAPERPRFVRNRRAGFDEEGKPRFEKFVVPTLNQMLGTDAQYFGYTTTPPNEMGEKPADGREAQAYLDAEGRARQERRPTKLNFLSAFPESLVQVVQYESNFASPRFGLPVRYLITLNDPQEEMSGIGLPTASVYVHWSRVIHVADTHHTATSSKVFAVPRMRPVLNRLLDLRKLYSGSGEMYWRGAFPGISLETHPQLGGDVEMNASALRTMMTSYMDGLQRYLALSGMSAKSLSPQVVDAGSQIDKQLEAICIKLNIPKRKFMGSERGELASGQDDSDWNDSRAERQLSYLTPHVIVPFFDRLIALGVLPEPGQAPVGLAVEAMRTSPPPLPLDSNLGSIEALAQPPAVIPPAAGVVANADVLVSIRERHGITVNKKGLLIVPVQERRFLVNAETGNVVGEQGKGYNVVWPDLNATDEKEQSAVAEAKTRALVQYVTGGVETIIPPMFFLTNFLNMEEDEALATLTKAAQDLEDNSEGDDTGGSRLLGFAGGVQAILQMFQMFTQGAISRETLKQLIMLFYKVGSAKAEKIISQDVPGTIIPNDPAAAAAQGMTAIPPQAPPAPTGQGGMPGLFGQGAVQELPAYGNPNATDLAGLPPA